MLILIRGAGDLATGTAIRLMHAGFCVILTETASPLAIRRTVAFSEAVRNGFAEVEGIRAELAHSPDEALEISRHGKAAVLTDPDMLCLPALSPTALVDAILAKRNTGTHITDAPVVIGMGPGFTAGVDCHAAIETMRGHDLGRVLYAGSPLPNTGIPGEIGGHSAERVLRAPADGVFFSIKHIGDSVRAGDTVATVDGTPMKTAIDGVLRGLLPDGVRVTNGLKSGDVDPRCDARACFTVSDKARSLGGAVLEAILHFTIHGDK